MKHGSVQRLNKSAGGFSVGLFFWISKPQDGAKTSASILIQQKQIHLLIKEFNDAYEASLDKGGFFSHFQSANCFLAGVMYLPSVLLSSIHVLSRT